MIIRNHSLPSYQQDFLQASLIHIETKNVNFVLAAIYCPPRYTMNLTRLISFLTQLGNRFIAGGYFNSKHTQWGSRLTTPRGRQLFQALNSTHTSFISTGKPTHWPTDTAKRPHLLDFFLVKGIPAIQTMVEENIDLSSDHIPLLLTVASEPLHIPSASKLVNNRTDWDRYGETLNNIDAGTQAFANSIYKAAKAATQTTNEAKHPSAILYPLKIRQLVEGKSRARRQWQNSRSPADKTILNRLCKKLKEEVREIKNTSFQSYLLSLTPTSETDYSLWKATKKIGRPVLQVPPLRKTDGTWARSDDKKAVAFATHLEQIFHT